MKAIATALLTLLITSTVFAKSPFDTDVQSCVKSEMVKQHPIYARVIIADFLTFAHNSSDFDYLVYLANRQTGQIDARSFIVVSGAKYSQAKLYFAAHSNPTKLDLSSCF